MLSKFVRLNKIGRVLSARNFLVKPIVVSLAMLTGSQSSLAQDANIGIEEVMVTAQKREQNVQDVPIAITVFSTDELDKLGIVDLQGISQRTPGFTLGSKDAASSQLSIRGIGSVDDGAAADNSVIVYVDEVPIGRAAGVELDLFDLERVEVLRGPQGTLFGRNAVGGALSLVTSKPTEELKVKLEAKLGSFDQREFRGLISGKIANNVFGKISLSQRTRDGFLDSTIDELPQAQFEEFFPNLTLAEAGNINAFDIDRTTVRAALRFTPNENLEINLTGSTSELDEIGAQRVFIGDDQQFGGTRSEALLPGNRFNFQNEFFEDPGFDQIDSDSIAVRFDYSFANDYTFTSISSLRDVSTVSSDVTSTEGQARALLSTGLGGDVLIAPVAIPFEEDSSTFTQEFRLTSSGEQKLKWVAGAFFLDEDVFRDERVTLGLLQRQEDGSVDVLAPVGESGDAQDVNVSSFAFFGQLDYALTPQLEATVGLRYTEDDKEISRIGTADGIVVAEPFDVQNDATFDEVTGRFALSYTPVEDVLVFGSYSRGFKSGGFQGRGTTELAVSTPFDPEIADTFEFGLKSTFFGGRLQLNPTVFYTDFSDLQVVELLRPAGSPEGTTSSLVTQNAANAEIEGFELEYSWFPVDGLTIRGAYTVLNAEFTEFFAPAGFENDSGAGLSDDRAGNSLSKSPDFSISQLVRYEWDSAAVRGRVAAQAEYIHKEEQFNEPENLADVAIPAYDVFNLSLTYVPSSNENISFTLWSDNVFDENYLLFSLNQGGGGRASPAAPRTTGLTVRWNY